MSLISAQEARENADKFSLSSDEMLNEVANAISANSKLGKTEIVVAFLSKVVDQSELNFVEKSLKEKGYSVNSSNIEDKIYIKETFARNSSFTRGIPPNRKKTKNGNEISKTMAKSWIKSPNGC